MTPVDLRDIDLLSIAVQLFHIGKKCAEKNFPLVNWKTSNLLIKIKALKNIKKSSTSLQMISQVRTPLSKLQTEMETKTNMSKIIKNSLKLMDLYDYFGIENRDPKDPLLPPELRQERQNTVSNVPFNENSLEQSSIFMTGMVIALLLR